MPYKFLKFTKRIDRRSPRNEGDVESPIMRENWLARDGVLKRPPGTEPLNYFTSYQFPSTYKFLLHYRDDFTSEFGQVPTIVNGAIIDKTDGAFGQIGCGKFDGSDDYISYPDSADYYFGTADFTVKTRVKFADLTNAQTIIGQRASADELWFIEKGTNAGGNKIQIKFRTAASTKADYVATSAINFITGRWYDIEVVRSTTSILLKVDGEVIALTETTAIAANDVGNISALLILGQQNSTNYLNGKLDETLIVKGLALHTAKFAPETAPFAPTEGQTGLTDIVTWKARYDTTETGAVAPRTFAYTQDGKLWEVNDIARTVTQIKEGLNVKAYPKSWLVKSGEQTILYLVDGKDLYKFDGNNDLNFDKVDITDTGGKSINPIDVIEHKDRLLLISDVFMFVSANLKFDVFNDANDSIQIVIGSGKGKNRALGKIDDRAFVLNTEGHFVLEGDVISALAATFEIRLVDASNPIIMNRSAVSLLKGIIYLATDLNLYSFNGNSSIKLTHSEKLEDFVNPKRDMLDKGVATFEEDYYKLSFVRTSEAVPRIEVWYDTLRRLDNVNNDFVVGRNVSCYMHSDPSVEESFMQFGRSDVPKIMWANRSLRFDDKAIECKIWTKDITVQKGRNVRFLKFFPEFESTDEKDITFMYFLDSRTDQPSGADPTWSQNLRGETRQFGLFKLKTQDKFISRIRPKIKYARGQSISFFVADSTIDLVSNFSGIGIKWVVKPMKRGRTIGK